MVSAGDAIGRISADTLSAYPPGIPNLMAGEVVTPEAIEFLQETVRAPFGHVLRWRAPRRVSHPCHDLSRAIDAMTHCPTRAGYLDGMFRSRTDKHVTQPSSFSNSEMSTRTGV